MFMYLITLVRQDTFDTRKLALSQITQVFPQHSISCHIPRCGLC